MPNQRELPNTIPNEREKQFRAIQIQLRSQRAGDIWKGINRVRRWLQENPKDQAIYELLLNAVEENRRIRENVRNLLIEMQQKGAVAAGNALDILPSSWEELLADADDAYYATEYSQAVQLYRRVLKLNPECARAKEQVEKAKTDEIYAGDSAKGIPRGAVQYYRRARSFLAARDFVPAIKSLNAAVEACWVRGIEYPDAEGLLDSAQDSLMADEYKQKANYAIEKDQMQDALNAIEKGLALQQADETIKRELESLRDFIHVELELKEKGILALLFHFRSLQKGLKSARSVINPDSSLLKFVEKRLSKIRLFQIGSLALVSAIVVL